MRGMANKGIDESKSGSREYNRQLLNNYEEFAVTVRGLRDVNRTRSQK